MATATPASIHREPVQDTRLANHRVIIGLDQEGGQRMAAKASCIHAPILCASIVSMPLS